MIRAALIGLGKMGLSHLSIINAHPDVELAAVCDPSDYVREVVTKYSGLKGYSDYRKMLSAESFDAVFVATPSRYHAEIVRMALDAGVHVFCEKPFCLDPADSMALAEIAESRGLVNQVGYHYRHVAVFDQLKQLIGAKTIGKLHHIRVEAYGPVVLRPKGSTWRTQKVEGGGCLWDYACHGIDLANYLVGPPDSVGGAVVNRLFSADVDDEVYASFFYDNAMTGHVAANWSDDSYRKMSMKVSVWGENGRAVADRQELQIYIRDNKGLPYEKGWNTRYTTDLTEPVWFYLRGEEYSSQIDGFVQAVQAGRTDTRSTFRSAAETSKVVAAIARNATGARTAVHPEVPETRPAAKAGFWSGLRQGAGARG
jgi:scyllo-inositol 2-dehydrogenase (NADP+)